MGAVCLSLRNPVCCQMSQYFTRYYPLPFICNKPVHLLMGKIYSLYTNVSRSQYFNLFLITCFCVPTVLLVMFSKTLIFVNTALSFFLSVGNLRQYEGYKIRCTVTRAVFIQWFKITSWWINFCFLSNTQFHRPLGFSD